MTFFTASACRRFSRVGRAFAALALVCPLLASALPVGVGDVLAPLTLTDQHDRPIRIDAQTRIVIFSAEKPVSDWVSGVLSSQPAGVLGRLEAVYVSDISGMPSLITQMFALPKLRKLEFPMALAREASVVADLPRLPGMAAVLTMRDAKVLSVQQVSDAAQLQRALGLSKP